MGLPAPLVRLRTHLAVALGMPIRSLRPVTLRVARFYYEILARSRLRGRVAPGVQFNGPVHTDGEAKVHIGAGSRLGRGVVFETYDGAEILIGERVTINDGCVVVAYGGIEIGSHTMIGEFVSIRDANHGILKGTWVHDQPHVARRIKIGSDCWVGRGCFVAAGAQVADGAVIGANSVVTRPIPANAVAFGSPAEVRTVRETLLEKSAESP